MKSSGSILKLFLISILFITSSEITSAEIEELSNNKNLRSKSETTSRLLQESTIENVPKDHPPEFAVSSIEGCRRFPAIDTFYTPEKVKSAPKEPITWSNVVFIIFIYNSQKSNDFVAAHYQTWMRRLGEGADIVFVTDATDERPYDEILPYWKTIKAVSHLYRSPAKNEGKHLRYKVIDGFRHTKELFSKENKKYFVKMDTDTYIIPENLLRYFNDLELQTYQNPVMFGYAVCVYELRETQCYGAGSGYGFNKIGFDAVTSYFENNPGITDEVYSHPTFKRNLLVHEDFMMGVVYKRATEYPIVHNRLMFPYNFQRYGPGFLVTKRNAISYHKLDLADFGYTEDLFYEKDGLQRSFDQIRSIANNSRQLKEDYLLKVKEFHENNYEFVKYGPNSLDFK